MHITGIAVGEFVTPVRHNQCGGIGERRFPPKLRCHPVADHAAPCHQTLGRMILHPIGELRRTHQAGLHRDIGEIRGRDGLLVAISRIGETPDDGDYLDDKSTPSLRWPTA